MDAATVHSTASSGGRMFPDRRPWPSAGLLPPSPPPPPSHARPDGRPSVGAESNGGAPSSRLDNLVRNSASAALWTTVSRLTGLVRVGVVAAVLGPTRFGNLFQAANFIPNVLYLLLAGAVIGALLVPPVVGRLRRGDLAAAEALAGRFLSVTIGAGLLAGAVLVIARGVFGRLLTLGVDGAEGELLRSASALLLVLVAPQLIGYGIAGVAAAAQNACGRYAFPAAAPIVENVGVVVAMLVAAWRYGTGAELAAAGRGAWWILGGGASAAVAAHALLQVWWAWVAGLRLRPRWPWGDAELSAMVRLAVPSLGSTALTGARFFLVAAVSATIPGGWVALLVAINVYNLPVALGGRPVASALLPILGPLSDRHNPASARAFERRYREGLATAAFVAVPAAVCFLFLCWPFARLLSVGAMSTGSGTALLAWSIAGLAPAVVAESAFEVSRAAAYARRDARGPLHAAVIRLALTALGVPVLLVIGGPPGLGALACAWTLGDVVSTARLHARVSLGTPPRLALSRLMNL